MSNKKQGALDGYNETTKESVSITIKEDDGNESIDVFKESGNTLNIVQNDKDETENYIKTGYDVKDEDMLDGFLLYDYLDYGEVESKNILIFRPKLNSFSDSDIIIRRVDLIGFKLNYDKIIGKQSLGKEFVTVDRTTTKKQCRELLEKNKKFLTSIGIDLEKEFHGESKTGFVVNGSNGKVYDYDKFVTSGASNKIIEYLSVINTFGKEQQIEEHLTWTGEASSSEGKRIQGKCTLAHSMVISVPVFNSLIVSDNSDEHKKTPPLSAAGVRNKDVVSDFEIYKESDNLGDFASEFNKRYEIDIYDMYHRTSRLVDADRLTYASLVAAWLIGGGVDSKKKPNYSRMDDYLKNIIENNNVNVYPIILSDLIVNYMGKDYYNASVDGNISYVMFNAAVQQMGEINASKIKALIYQKGYSLESLGKMVYFKKRQAWMKFMNALLKEFSLFNPSSRNIDHVIRYTNFLNVLFGVYSKVGGGYFSTDEFEILNTFRRAFNNVKIFDNQYDKIGFDNVLRKEIMESKNEKMGMYVDSDIKKNCVYLYQIIQKSDSRFKD